MPFIRVDPNNTAAPNYDVIEQNPVLANLLANTNYPDCTNGPGLTYYPAATFKQSQMVTCQNLPNQLNTDIYEI